MASVSKDLEDEASQLAPGKCVMKFHHEEAVAVPVMFLSKNWTHVLSTLSTVAPIHYQSFQNIDCFICTSLEEEFKPPKGTNNVKGLLLVNSDDSFEISDDIRAKIQAQQSSPMCILKKSNGLRLLEHLKNKKDTSVPSASCMVYATAKNLKLVAKFQQFFQVGELQDISEGERICTKEDVILFHHDPAVVKRKMNVFPAHDERRLHVPHYCDVQASIGSTLLSLVAYVLDHPLTNYNHLKAILVSVNINNLAYNFFSKFYEMYRHVTVAVIFTGSPIFTMDHVIITLAPPQESRSSMKQKEGKRFSSLQKPHSVVEIINKYPWSVKTALESVNEVWIIDMEWHDAVPGQLELVAKRTGSQHLPLHICAVARIARSSISSRVSDHYRNTIYQAICVEDTATTAENLLSMKNLRLKEFASRTKEYFVAECTKDIIQEIFWRIVYLFYLQESPKEIDGKFWHKVYQTDDNVISLSDDRLVNLMKKWICLQSLLNIHTKPLTVEKLMKILNAKAFDCTFVNAKRLAHEWKEVVFRNNKDATSLLFDLLLTKGTTKEKSGLVAKAKQMLFDRKSHSHGVATLGSFSEGLSLITTAMKCNSNLTEGSSLKRKTEEFAQFMSRHLDFMKPDEPESFYRECKKVFAEKLDITSVEETMNYSMEVSIEKFVKDLPRLQQIMDDPFGTIIHVKVVEKFMETWTKSLDANSPSKSLRKDSEAIMLCNSILERFAKEKVIHRHVCTFLYALISHTPSKDAIAVLGCLTELSLPLLDTSVCVESTCGDLSKGMTTFIRNNHLQAIAIKFLTTFLSNPSTNGSKELSMFEKCRFNAFCPIQSPIEYDCLSSAVSLLLKIDQKNYEVDEFLSASCWKLVSMECEAQTITMDSIPTLCSKRSIQILATLFSLQACTQSDAATFVNWHAHFRKSFEDYTAKLKQDETTLAETAAVQEVWDHVKYISHCLHLAICDDATPQCMLKRIGNIQRELEDILYIRLSESEAYDIGSLLRKYKIQKPSSLGYLQEIMQHDIAEYVSMPMSLQDIFKMDVPIRTITSVVATVCWDLKPMEDYRGVFAYICSRNKCYVFQQYLRISTSPPLRTIQNLFEALKMTVNFLQDLASKGVFAMHKELQKIDICKRKEEEIKTEVALWRGWISSLQENLPQVICSYSNMLKAYREIGHLHAACEQYQLQACLNDGKMNKLMSIFERWSSINTESDVSNGQVLTDMNTLQNITFSDISQSEYFHVIKDSQEFHSFLIELNRVSKSRFHDLFGLLSQYLPDEKHTEDIMHCLEEAQQAMQPFTDVEQSLTEIMEKVGRVRAYRESLITVNENMNTIKRWFRNAEGYTLESVLSELVDIMQSGVFLMEEGGGNAKRERVLQFQSDQKRIWNESDLNNFSRRLGLLEKTEKTKWNFPIALKDSVKLYQDSLLYSQKILMVINRLEELGKTADFKHGELLKCCENQEDAVQARKICHSKLEQCKREMEEWKGNLSSVRECHEKLLLFMIPKLKILEKILCRKHSTDEVGRELIYLCASCQPSINPTTSEMMPFENVGIYLSEIQYRTFSSVFQRPADNINTHSVHVLSDHHGHQEIIQILFDIYEGIPNSLVVYQCRVDTTEEELEIFFKRAKPIDVLKQLPFTVMGTNILPLRMQETMVKFHQRFANKNTSAMHYVTFGSTLMTNVSGISVIKCGWTTSTKEWHHLVEICKPQLARRYSLQLIYGCAGCGKSHFIQEQLKKCLSYTVITIDESFSVDTAIRKLRDLCLNGYEGPHAIHFNFTFIFPMESGPGLEEQKYSVLLHTLQWFFTNLFFFTYVEDFQSGLSFGFPDGQEWPIFIEVPSLQGGVYLDPETFLIKFQNEFPVFKIVGRPKLIDHRSPFDAFDEDVLLVCKYLQAFNQREDEKFGINKSFRGHLDEKVSFSQMPDVSLRECHRLLSIYTPLNAKQSKMTWWNFIRFLARKCRLMERCPFFTQKTRDGSFGSILFNFFLEEANQLCNQLTASGVNENQSQLVLIPGNDGKETFHYISAKYDQPSTELCTLLSNYQGGMERFQDMESRGYLDMLLAGVFGLELQEKLENGESKKYLAILDEKKYVLTVDFALKMIQINERMLSGCPVIIEGETGVGKTFLIEIISCFWNESVLRRWTRVQTRLKERINKLCQKYGVEVP